MSKRKLAIAALFLTTFLTEGCCGYIQRPFVFRRLWWAAHEPCCASASLGTPCCAGSSPVVDFSQPPLANPTGPIIPGSPSMPNSQPLTRARFPGR